jgi:hypothetical protein
MLSCHTSLLIIGTPRGINILRYTYQGDGRIQSMYVVLGRFPVYVPSIIVNLVYKVSEPHFCTLDI